MDDHSKQSVRATYDRIGRHFAQTRVTPWPEVEEFLAGRTARRAVDIGCGNGRHSELLASLADRVLALDASQTMLETARERLSSASNAELLAGDATALPLDCSTIDLALYVATLHHLPRATDRAESLVELERILRPDGTALVSAWSTTHDRFEEGAGFDTTVDWTMPDGSIVDRFYHIVDPNEFATLLEESPLSVTRIWTSSGNCYATVRATD